MIKSYVRKPSVVQAMRWDGKSLTEVFNFMGDVSKLPRYQLETKNGAPLDEKAVRIGDYVVKDGESVRFLSKHEFEQMYELLD